MINVWPLVERRMPDAELWIAGDGDLRRELESLVVDGGPKGKVRFWGAVSEERKQELLGHCSCLALPSRKEGFGLVYLEALRMGRPCLVSTLDAGREVVNPPEAGLAADVQNPEALTDAVCRLLSMGPEWVAWSRRARERYEAHFTAKHFQARLWAALAPLL
jgi:phosphatidylinositol alpha-1,6-mannosyltransferase